MTELMKPTTFSLVPTSFNEAMKYAELIAQSDFAPGAYKGKPVNVLVALQMGHEIGLQPMQALQNIAVINGKPSLYGDAMVAVCQKHPAWEGFLELTVGQVKRLKTAIDAGKYAPTALEAFVVSTCDLSKDGAICAVQRKGEPPHAVVFTEEQAKQAGLLGKSGPWTLYKDRMMQMRARGFALRDRFSDALKGLISAEEAQDYVVHDAPTRRPMPRVADAAEVAKVITVVEEIETDANGEVIGPVSVDQVMASIQSAGTLEELNSIADAASLLEGDDKEMARECFSSKKRYLKGQLAIAPQAS